MKPADIARAIQSLARHQHAWDVWRDFIEMAAISISNAVDIREPVRTEREEAYLRIAKKYEKSQLIELSRILGMVTEALETDMTDILGQTYMMMELGNKWTGQFFTPDSLSQMLGVCVLDPEDARQHIARRGHITLSEPSIGGGATVIGAMRHLRSADINYQTCVHVTGVDVDIKSVHMAYIQLSLLGAPAVIVHGNTLTLEEWSRWYTPMHIMGGWTWRLRRAERQPIQSPEEPATVKDSLQVQPNEKEQPEQITLFQNAGAA